MDQTFGRYRLLERLGEGGMAEVFKAKSFGVEGFEKVLVIKRILPKLAEHQRFIDLFVHEAKLAVRLSHANIVQVFDLGRVDRPSGEATAYFMAMEYVPGLDLSTLLARCRRLKQALPFGLAVHIAAEVAKALDHAHRRRDEQARPLGIVHRDVSPQNILLSWEGEVKVTDFGIAKAKDSLDTEEEAADARAGRVRGKLAYMSPEQARGGPLDGRSDLFSLGTVLYEMIGGAHPFSAPTSQETMRRVQSGEYPPLDLLRPDVPPALVDIVRRLLEVDPALRYADAASLHEALLGWFYTGGERYGDDRLAEFLAPFRESRAQSAPTSRDMTGALSLPGSDPGGSPGTGEPHSRSLEAGGAFADEHTGATEKTPVEVPQVSARTPTPSPAAVTIPPPDGSTPARALDLGERREVTALAVTLGESRPRTDAEAPSPARARAREVLARYGASILEEGPEQLVAIFGLGDADGRDTEAAVRAGLVITRARAGGTAASAGVHVAAVALDGAGSPVSDERLGTLVATAQTLSRAAEGRVALSPLAARVVRGAFPTEPERSPAGAGAGAARLVVAGQQAAPMGRFVGRHQELRQLGEVLARATKKRAQLISIGGDKGVGKSRLLAEMQRRLAKGNYNVGFYSAHCPLNGAGIPWSALTSMLHVLCGIQEGDDERRILEVQPRLRALGLQDDETRAVLAQLGAREGDSAPGGTSGALRTAFARMVQSLCDDRLHLFAWDDAQTMDSATLEVVLGCVERSMDRAAAGGMRAVFLFASRDPVPPSLAAHARHHAVPIGDLADADSARLIGERIGARVLPAELLAFCQERAGGHPLFLEELVRELLDSGAVVVEGGAVKARLEGATAVPRTLRTLIAARVGRLGAAERATLQAAAVLGDPVPLEVVAAMLGQSVAQVDRSVAALAGRDLLRASGAAQASFASPMHAEIVLDTIAAAARRELHAGAAAAYASAFGDAGFEHAERIAEHQYQAGDRDAAATFFAQAARARARLGQLEPAIVLMGRALDLCDFESREPAELGGWLEVLADAVTRVRAARDLGALAARALGRIDAAGDTGQRVLARVDVARALGAVHLFADAHAHLAKAFVLAGEVAPLLARALAAELEIGVRSGDFARAAQAGDRLQVLGVPIAPRAWLAMAQARAATGDRSALEAVDAAERLGDPADLVLASEREKQRVLVHIYCRDFDKAIEASARAVELSRAAGLRFETAAALHNLGDAARRLGDLPRAYASLRESLETAESAGHERLVSLNRVHLAWLDGVGGKAGAEDELRDLVRYADARGYRTDALEGRYLLAALQQRRGDEEGARKGFTEARAEALALGNQLVAEDAREALGEA